MTTDIVVGSIRDIAQKNEQSIAETFLGVNHVALVDTSGSMIASDSRDGKTRYDVACEELAHLQKTLPGEVAVISWSDSAIFCPSGVPTMLNSMTNMAAALKFAKVADLPGVTFYLISDGEPTCSEEKVLQLAKSYTAKINGIFVGPEDECGGRNFLIEVARVSGGTMTTADCADGLATSILLLSDGSEQKPWNTFLQNSTHGINKTNEGAPW